ncbi:MAG: LPS-assembly protein LptD [Deltaproteobacteria bacterium]|nr:LPS-assembly protein LptD [Deltaproteobacteria bacterium]
MSIAVEPRRGRILFLPSLLFFLMTVSSGWAQTLQQEQNATHVQADTLHYDEQQNTVTASGNVSVLKGETTLKADTVIVHRATNELEAQGNVVVKDPQGQIDANSLRFEMEDETGTIKEGTVRLPRNQFILTGETLQKSYGQTYHIENGAFTTCQCENFQKADWSIGGQAIDVTLRGRGEVHDGLFRVRDLPFAYIPYGTVSVRTDRQSGLLFPHYAFSSKRGFVWQQPLYWAIDRSYDLTFTTDVETAARAGLWADFRYAPNLDTEGQFSASYFNEQLRGPATTSTPVDRWSITGTHRQDLTDDMRFYSDFFFVSDKLFLREITHYALNLPQSDDYADWTLRTRRFTDSHVGGLKTWKNALLRAESSYYQDLIEDQDRAFQVLPRLQFQGQQYLWRDRLEASVAVEGDNFYRNKGYGGQRFDLAPSVALPFHLGDYAFGSVRVTGRETAYHLASQAPGLSTIATPKLRGDRTREIAQIDAEIGTRFSRVFDVNWGKFLKLQHVVEPEVSYRYVPFVNQDDLPFYDSLDRINKRNVFVYGVSNRFLGKFRTTPAEGEAAEGSTEIRELGRLTITQAYDPQRSLSREVDHYSDVDIAAQFTPFPFTSFRFDSTYAVDNGNAATTRVGAFLRDPRSFPPLPPLLQHLQRTSSIGVTYRSTSNRLIKEFNSGLTNPTDISPPKEVDTLLTLRLTDSLMGSYIGRYDLNTSSFLGNRYFFRYIAPQQCWYIDFGVIDKVNPREFEFRVLFTLVGLSSSGHTAF